jgi:multidrug efflux pump subunit AcrA (membrane-fusion protein)
MSPEPTHEYTAYYGTNATDELNASMAKWAAAGWTLHSAIPIPGSVLMIWERLRPEGGDITDGRTVDVGLPDIKEVGTIDIALLTPTGFGSSGEGVILEWSVGTGEAVKEGERLVEIDFAECDMELPAPTTGTLVEILVMEGASVSAGQIIARMTTSQ